MKQVCGIAAKTAFNSTNLLKSDSSFYEENFIVISEILRNFNFLNFIKFKF